MKRRMGIKYLTVKEAAEMIGISLSTLRAWDKTGKLKAKRDKKNNYRSYRIPEIESFMKRNNLKHPSRNQIIDD